MIVAMNIPLRKDVDIIIVPAGSELTLPAESVVISDVQIRVIETDTRYIDPATGEQVIPPGPVPNEVTESKLTIRTDWKEHPHGR